MAEYNSVREVSGQSQMTPGYGWPEYNSVHVKFLDSHR